jgi:addiction module HigA family antidote
MKTPNLRTNPAVGILEDALEHESIKPAQAARDMGIPRSRLCDIFAGRKGISSDTALRVEEYLGIPAMLLMQLQSDFELSKAKRLKGDMIRKSVRRHFVEA